MSTTTDRPAKLTGRVVRPGDSDYPAARDCWNLLFNHDPRVIVFAQETQDVVNAVGWARQNPDPDSGTQWWPLSRGLVVGRRSMTGS